MRQQTEISISDILNFLRSNWKLYLASLILFVVVAIGATIVLPQYTASLILKHNVQSRPLDVSGSIESLYDGHWDLVTWRDTQEKLILLAKQQEKFNHPVGELIGVSSPSWWSQHIAPVKALSTDEAKELLGINAMIVGTNKPTEDSNAVYYLGRAIKESTRISGLAVTFTAPSSQKAIESTVLAAQYLKNIASVLRFKNYIAGLEQTVLASTNKINLEFAQLNKELIQYKKLHSELKRLYKEYPESSRVILDGAFHAENSKYLPLANQLVANSLNMYELESRINELEELKKLDLLYRKFIAESQKIFLAQSNYPAIFDDLLSVELAIRKQVQDSDFAAIYELNTIHSQLSTINHISQAQFTQNNVSIIKKPDYYKTAYKAAFLGLAVGFLLSLLILLLRVASYRRHK